jgi:hypothetical protein
MAQRTQEKRLSTSDMKLIHEVHHRSRPQKRSKGADLPKQNIGHSIGGVARYAWSEFDIDTTAAV